MSQSELRRCWRLVCRRSEGGEQQLNKTESLVNGFLESGRNRGLSSQTTRWYEGILYPFAARYPELPISPGPIEAYIGSYNAGADRKHAVYRALRAFYNFINKRFDTENPIPLISPPRRRPVEKEALTLEQLKHLLDYPGHDHMTKAFLHVFADTGCRLGEASQLTGKDIGEANLTLKGKTGTRVVPILPEVKAMLVGIMPPSTAKDQRLFPHTKDHLGKLIKRSMIAAGLEGFSCHSLRHTFCTLFTGTDSALKQITGHHSWQMIDNYRHRKDAHAADQHRLHSPLAQLSGNSKDGQQIGEASYPGETNLEVIIRLATELGEAKERIRHLESQLKPVEFSRQN